MKIIFLVLTLLLVLHILTLRLEKQNLFFPIRELESTPAAIGLEYESVQLVATDGTRLSAWFIPSAGSGSDTVLICHGNGGNISHRLGKIAFFNELGLDVLIFDYRGYGESEGSPDEQGIYRDVMAAYDYLIHDQARSPQSIVVFGESLGGAVAAYLASRVPVKAIITVSAFTSVPEMSKQIYPYLPTFFIRTKLNTLAYMTDVKVAKLIIHSSDDSMVPVRMGRQIYAAASEPKRFLEIHGEHNSAFFESENLTKAAVKAFLGDTP